MRVIGSIALVAVVALAVMWLVLQAEERGRTTFCRGFDIYLDRPDARPSLSDWLAYERRCAGGRHGTP